MSKLNNTEKVSYKRTVKILCVFFVLSVISVAMVYTKFVQGVEDFWKDKAEDVSLLEDGVLSELIDLDAYAPTDEPREIELEELALEYMEKQGGVSVFEEIFTKYIE